MPTIEIIEGGNILEYNSEAWDELFRVSQFATPFQSRQWFELWLTHFGSPSRLRTVVVKEGNDLVGLFPLIRSTSAWRAFRPAGVGPSDYLCPLQLDGQKNISDCFHHALVDLSKHHLIDLHQFPSDHPFANQFPGMKTVEQARCLILDLPKSIDEYVASLSKSLRYDVRRLRGKALKERGATVEWISEASANNFADQFFALHRARWKSRGLPGAFFGKNEPFQRNWIIAGAKSGMVLMNRLVCEGSTVGTVYAMKHGNTCYFYQAGMEPTASSLSPGTILVSKMIERAIELGCDTFDFMRGDEPYKRRWKPNRERINHRILLPPPNVVGKAGMWWNSTAWRVELKVRDRLEGKSLRPTKVTNPNP